jgi:hypothetical protein
MPLAFNLLAPWGHPLERASGYLIELLPAFTGSARQLLFEHSPGRGNLKFTGDHTAFDALIRYSDGQGRNGFVAFEIKFSENMREPMPELKPRHAELSPMALDDEQPSTTFGALRRRAIDAPLNRYRIRRRRKASPQCRWRPRA